MALIDESISHVRCVYKEKKKGGEKMSCIIIAMHKSAGVGLQGSMGQLYYVIQDGSLIF